MFLYPLVRREKESVREAYNIFNLYADKLLGPEFKEIQINAFVEIGFISCSSIWVAELEVFIAVCLLSSHA